ncbi:MAG: hypothetical protein R3332_05950 [Pseudohongiellaceae bacterium]|nr:hypothetical protein [Pseudohongiellaceae bacterium]
MKYNVLVLLAGLSAISQIGYAEVCDYAPSNLIGGKAAAAAGVTSGTVAATGAGMQAAGLYTITHATAGTVMLGSTAAGVSAAGTTGIIAGTGGVIGTVGAVLMSPFVIIPAAVVAVGIGAYEGGCHFASKDDEDNDSE